MKNLVVLSFIACGCTLAQASFELALVLDRTTRKVHRFDTVSGAYLGSFGSFSATAATLAINVQRNEVIVWDPGVGGVYHHNYNTGQLNNVTFGWNPAIPKFGYTPNGNHLLLPINQSIIQYNFDLSSTNSYTPSGASGLFGRHGLVDSNRFLISDSNGKITQNNHTSKTVQGTIPYPGTAFTGICSSPVSLQNGEQVGAAVTSSGNLTLFTLTPTTLTARYSVSALMTSPQDIAPLHRGFVVVGRNAGVAVLQTFAVGSSVGGGVGVAPGITLSGGGIGDPVSVATVVAPEPSTAIAAGLGLTMLARRRRR